MYVTEGVKFKPKECKLCPLHLSHHGFCPDHLGTSNLMLLLESPFSDDVINQVPLSGKMGFHLEQKLFKKFNIKREDITICNVLRCKGPYPQTNYRQSAENNCRQHDKVIRKFNPNLFAMTYSITDTYDDPCFLSLLEEDLKKSIKLAENKENRVCLLCGENAISMINNLPFRVGKGGLRQWRGHYFKGEWNFNV